MRRFIAFVRSEPSRREAVVICGARKLNCVGVDDVNLDSAGACGEAARGDAGVNAAPLPPRQHVNAGDVRRARGCGHVRELHAGDSAHVAR